MMRPYQAQDAPECSKHSLGIAPYPGTKFNFSRDFSIHKTPVFPLVRLGVAEPCDNVPPERPFGSQRAIIPWKGCWPNSQDPTVLQ